MSSARNGWQGTVKIPVPERESPNRQVPYVSAHIRVYWPGNATYEQIEEAMDRAFYEAQDEVYFAFHPDACRECFRRGDHRPDCSRR